MQARLASALKSWLIVYPLITGLIALLDPILQGIVLPVRTFILSGLMVFLLSGLIHPVLNLVAARWHAE